MGARGSCFGLDRGLFIVCKLWAGMICLKSARCVGVGSEHFRAATEREIRLILSVGGPHESDKRSIIMVTSVPSVIIILLYRFPHLVFSLEAHTHPSFLVIPVSFLWYLGPFECNCLGSPSVISQPLFRLGVNTLPAEAEWVVLSLHSLMTVRFNAG